MHRSAVPLVVLIAFAVSPWAVLPHPAASPGGGPLPNPVRPLTYSQAGQTQAKECRLVAQLNQGVDTAPPPTIAIDPVAGVAGSPNIPLIDSWVSPDGRYAAQIVPAGATNTIALTLAVGLGNSRLLGPFGGDVSDLNWAPDSQTLVFSLRSPDGSQSLVLLPIEKPDAPVRLTEGTGKDSAAVWSVDGTFVYFASADAQNRVSIRRIAVRGGNPAGQPEQVIASASGAFDLSPDSSQIAYAAADADQTVIRVHNLMKSAPATEPAAPPASEVPAAERTLVRTPDPVTAIAWSPQGDVIGYLQAGHLHLINVDGSGRRDLVSDLSLRTLRWWCRESWIDPSGAGRPPRR